METAPKPSEAPGLVEAALINIRERAKGFLKLDLSERQSGPASCDIDGLCPSIRVLRESLPALCPLDSEGQERPLRFTWGETPGLHAATEPSTCSLFTHRHSPEALLEAPCHVIPQEVGAE